MVEMIRSQGWRTAPWRSRLSLVRSRRDLVRLWRGLVQEDKVRG